jgi:hypothetical protein
MSKFIIYKGTGGLVHMLKGIALCIQKAKETNRILILDTLHHAAFKMNFSRLFSIMDPSLRYKDDYDGCPVTLDNQNAYAQCMHGKYWLLGKNITDVDWNTTDDVIIYAGCGRDMHFETIKVVPAIREKLDKEPKVERPYISGHFRNTDIRNNIQTFIHTLKKTVQQTGIQTFYLATDDSTARDQIATELPHLTIIQYVFPPPNIRNLHYTKDTYTQVYECLRDFYFILRSDVFIPSKSGMSELLIEMRTFKYTFF